MSSPVMWIWLVALVVVTFVVVPLALHLLHRTLRAARNIERYTREALTAGVGIAGNTEAVAALEETIDTASSILAAAESLKAQTAEIHAVVAGGPR